MTRVDRRAVDSHLPRRIIQKPECKRNGLGCRDAEAFVSACHLSIEIWAGDKEAIPSRSSSERLDERRWRRFFKDFGRFRIHDRSGQIVDIGSEWRVFLGPFVTVAGVKCGREKRDVYAVPPCVADNCGGGKRRSPTRGPRYQIHRHRDWPIADARKKEYGMPSGISQRHGNWRNCNFGRWRQNHRLAGNIMKVEATASTASIHHSV